MGKDSLDNVIRKMLDEDPDGWSWGSVPSNFRRLEHSSGVTLVFNIQEEWTVPFGRWTPPNHRTAYPFAYIKIGWRLARLLHGMRREAIRQSKQEVPNQ